MERDGPAPGFYGKVPSHGDFVGRRLPPGVRHCLDEWLQRALVQSRIDLGPAWLATWGSSPLWRFVIGAGVCSEEAWAGVMMPSADRVGRCFPLLLAAPVERTPSLHECMRLHDGWFVGLEELAMSSLDAQFSIDSFDARLIVFRSPCFVPAPSANWSDRHAAASMEARASPFDPSTDAPIAGNGMFLDGQSAWWTDGSPLVSPALAICNSLPSAMQFVALLDGRWAMRGWAQEQANLDSEPP